MPILKKKQFKTMPMFFKKNGAKNRICLRIGTLSILTKYDTRKFVRFVTDEIIK